MSSWGVSHSNCCFSRDILINTCQQPISNTVLNLKVVQSNKFLKKMKTIFIGTQGTERNYDEKDYLQNTSRGIPCVHKKDFNFSQDLVISSIQQIRVSPSSLLRQAPCAKPNLCTLLQGKSKSAKPNLSQSSNTCGEQGRNKVCLDKLVCFC